MNHNRFTEEKIIKALKQHVSRLKAADICQEYGIAE